jgi:hypothetical protein
MSSPKPSPDDAFKQLMKSTGRVLRERGFKGSAQNYRRALGKQWQAINIQKSQWRSNRDDPICFYVNIGIDYPALLFKRWLPLPATISKFIATKAAQTFRINDFFPESWLGWFECEGVDGWNFEEFCPRFERVLTDQLVPLLNTIETPEGLARVLRTMPWMMSAGSRAFVGKSLAPPDWDPVDRDAGKWKQDTQGLWWGPGEW